MSLQFITVATYNFSHDAYLAKNKLEAEGIPCIIADEFTIAMDWLYANALGGIKIKVPDYQYEDARTILEEDHSDDLDDLTDWELSEEFGNDLEIQDEVVCPNCHSSDSELIDSVQPKTLLSKLTLGAIHPQSRMRYKCHICLSEWDS